MRRRAWRVATKMPYREKSKCFSQHDFVHGSAANVAEDNNHNSRTNRHCIKDKHATKIMSIEGHEKQWKKMNENGIRVGTRRGRRHRMTIYHIDSSLSSVYAFFFLSLCVSQLKQNSWLLLNICQASNVTGSQTEAQTNAFTETVA